MQMIEIDYIVVVIVLCLFIIERKIGFRNFIGNSYILVCF